MSDVPSYPRGPLGAVFAGMSALEADSLTHMLPGHSVTKPVQTLAGIVFASPHSGRLYPDSFRDRTRLSLAQLRRNEDIFVDQLIESAPEYGAPLICARFPRCYIDANRDAGERPEKWGGRASKQTARAQAGLGVVPTHISERTSIYIKEPSQADVMARIDHLYTPYHRALSELLDDARDRFGQALLVDCHSMPGFAPMGSRRPDIILGDRFGQACEPETLAFIRRLFQDEGFSVATNYPYAGGFVTEHYGHPRRGVEAIQIEINRDLYLNPVTLSPKRGFEHLQEKLSRIFARLIEDRTPQALAAQ